MTGRVVRAVLAAALAGALAVGASGCGLDLFGGEDPGAAPSPSLSPSPVESPVAGTGKGAGGDRAAGRPPAGLERFYDQPVEWEECRTDKQCAEIEVPLDYRHPAGETITLALLKVPAESPDRRLGSLVVNPGGPGASGIDYAERAPLYFGPELRDSFDIVGFDPRGVGSSTPVECLDDDRLDAFVEADPDPETAEEARAARRLLAELGAGCVAESGALASHVSTVEAARDLDVVRAVVGDPRLNYFGASYGTLLGATYADMFPHRVGRMVLDGAVDPTLSDVELSLAQAEGFEGALRSYVGACVDAGDCFLGGTVDDGVARVGELLDRLDQAPAEVGDRRLTAGNAVLGVWAALYNEEYWPLLDAALEGALSGSGRLLLALSDAYTSRGPDGYLNNSLEALYAVNCLDRGDPASREDASEHVKRFEKASPTFGRIFAHGLSSCDGWPVSGPRRRAPLTAAGAAPILVIGTSRDPATPLAWAEALASQLESGVLIRRDGDGHTGYRAGNRCVDDAVEAFLVAGEAPEDGLAC